MKKERTKELFNAIGNIDEKFIDEAAEMRPAARKRNYTKWTAIAASLALAVAVGTIAPHIIGTQGVQTKEAVDSTAYYEGGDNANSGSTDGRAADGAQSSTDDTPAYPVTNVPEESDDGMGGVLLCEKHGLFFHHLPAGFLDLEGLDAEDYAAWYDSLHDPDPDSECPFPEFNIVSFIEYFNVPREDFELYLSENYYSNTVYYDLDAIYSGDRAAIEAWAECGEDENYRLAFGLEKSLIYMFRYELIVKTLTDERYTAMRDRYYVEDPYYDPEEEISLRAELGTKYNDDPALYERAFAEMRWKPREEYAGVNGDVFNNISLAAVIRDLGVSQDEAEAVYAEIARDYEGGRWSIDFDKLYSKLDYYAGLLGENGYEYSYLVDNEYIEK